MSVQTRAYWKSKVMNFYNEVLDTTWKSGVWADCPLLSIAANPQLAYVYFEDFLDFQTITNADPPTVDGFTCTQGGNTKGILAILAGIGGILQVDSESTTQHEGLHVQQNIANYLCAASKDIWYEIKFRVVDTYDKAELFVGLAKIDGTLIKSDGDLDTGSDYVGFGIETTGVGVVKFYECKDAAELSDTVVTIEENTWIRMGFKVTGITGIQAFINGVEVTLTNVIASGIPTTDALTTTLVCQTDATNDPRLEVDWVKCIQLR